MTAVEQLISCAEFYKNPDPASASRAFHVGRLDYLGHKVEAVGEHGPFKVMYYGTPLMLRDVAALGRFNWSRPVSAKERADHAAYMRRKAGYIAAGEKVLREMHAKRAAGLRST